MPLCCPLGARCCAFGLTQGVYDKCGPTCHRKEEWKQQHCGDHPVSVVRTLACTITITITNHKVDVNVL